MTLKEKGKINKMKVYQLENIDLKIFSKNRWLAWNYAYKNLGFDNPILKKIKNGDKKTCQIIL